MNYLMTIKLAFTAILANKTRAALTMLGILIGVLSVILLTALVSGLKSTITDQISGLGSNLIIVIPGKIGGGRGPGGVVVNKLTVQDTKDLQVKLQGEADVASSIQKITETKYANKSSKDVSVVGTDANFPQIINAVKVVDGRFFNNGESEASKRVVVIGQTVQKNLFPSEDPVGKVIIVDNLRYSVIGVLGKRGSIFGQDQDNVLVVPLTALQRQFSINNLNAIYINGKRPEDVSDIQKKAQDALSKRMSTDDFTVQTQEQTLSTISTITNVLTLGLGGIAAISLLVGGIGIMNIMLVSVTERTREIGLRKALGAKPADIRNQFLVEAITLSGIGGIAGIILGILLSLLINNFIQTTVTWWSVALSFGFSMIVGIIFGVAPAIRASRLDPIQALRYE